jgi:hypothetical protein
MVSALIHIACIDVAQHRNEWAQGFYGATLFFSLQHIFSTAVAWTLIACGVSRRPQLTLASAAAYVVPVAACSMAAAPALQHLYTHSSGEEAAQMTSAAATADAFVPVAILAIGVLQGTERISRSLTHAMLLIAAALLLHALTGVLDFSTQTAQCALPLFSRAIVIVSDSSSWLEVGHVGHDHCRTYRKCRTSSSWLDGTTRCLALPLAGAPMSANRSLQSNLLYQRAGTRTDDGMTGPSVVMVIAASIGAAARTLEAALPQTLLQVPPGAAGGQAQLSAVGAVAVYTPCVVGALLLGVVAMGGTAQLHSAVTGGRDWWPIALACCTNFGAHLL